MFFGGLNGDGFGEEYEWGTNGSYEHGEDRASYDPAPKATRCKYCKTGGLYWHQVNGRYRLYTSPCNHTNEFLHICKKYKKIEDNPPVSAPKKLSKKDVECPTCGTIIKFNPKTGRYYHEDE